MNMKKSAFFEAKFFAVVEQIRKKQGISKNDISRLAFPDQAKPDNKWQRLERAFKGMSKPQRITLEDAYNIASAIGYDLPDLIWKVWKESEK